MKCIVSRFKGKLVKMIKDFNGRLDHYTISTKIRQILLHWGFEMIYYQFIRKNCCKKQKIDIIMVAVEKKLLNIIKNIKNF